MKLDGVDEAEEPVDEEDRERLVVEEVWLWKEEAGIDCPLEEDDALEETVDEIELTVDFGVETELEAVEFTELVGCEEDWDPIEEADELAIPVEEGVDDIRDDVLTLELGAVVVAEERVDDDVELADEGAEDEWDDTLEELFKSPGREGSHGAFISRFSTFRGIRTEIENAKAMIKARKASLKAMMNREVKFYSGVWNKKVEKQLL